MCSPCALNEGCAEECIGRYGKMVTFTSMCTRPHTHLCFYGSRTGFSELIKRAIRLQFVQHHLCRGQCSELLHNCTNLAGLASHSWSTACHSWPASISWCQRGYHVNTVHVTMNLINGKLPEPEQLPPHTG